jgi:hypothetical protein
MPITILGLNFERVYHEFYDNALIDNDDDETKERKAVQFRKATKAELKRMKAHEEAGAARWFPADGDLRRKIFNIFDDPSSSFCSKIMAQVCDDGLH